MVNTVVYSVILMIEAFVNDSFGSLISYVCLLGTVLALFYIFRKGTGY